MDVETVEALDRLSDRIDRIEVSLRGEMRSMRDELCDELRGDFRGGLADHRRHAEVLFESLRDDIRLVAEGVAHLVVKVDRISR